MTVGEIIGYVVSIADAFGITPIIVAAFVLYVSVAGLALLVRTLRGS